MIGEGVCQDGTEAAFEEARAVVSRYNDAEEGEGHGRVGYGGGDWRSLAI